MVWPHIERNISNGALVIVIKHHSSSIGSGIVLFGAETTAVDLDAPIPFRGRPRSSNGLVENALCLRNGGICVLIQQRVPQQSTKVAAVLCRYPKSWEVHVLINPYRLYV